MGRSCHYFKDLPKLKVPPRRPVFLWELIPSWKNAGKKKLLHLIPAVIFIPLCSVCTEASQSHLLPPTRSWCLPNAAGSCGMGANKSRIPKNNEEFWFCGVVWVTSQGIRMYVDFGIGFASGRGSKFILDVGFGIEYLCFPIKYKLYLILVWKCCLILVFTSHFPVHIKLFGSKFLWIKKLVMKEQDLGFGSCLDVFLVCGFHHFIWNFIVWNN